MKKALIVGAVAGGLFLGYVLYAYRGWPGFARLARDLKGGL